MAALAFAACDKNEKPGFDDADAFVSFASSSATLAETTSSGAAGETTVTLTLASVAGISSTAEVKVIDSSVDETYKATEGKDFEVVSSQTLNFDAENRTASITIKSIPNGEYTGDMKFALSIVDGGKVGIGVESTCVVTINDSEHPLQSILGTYTGTAISYYADYGYGPYDVSMVITKDDDDVSKVWIDGLDAYMAKYNYSDHFYGVVNSDLTEIAVPVGQSYKGYSSATLYAYSDADFSSEDGHDLEDGENIILTVKDGGKTIVVENVFGAYFPSYGYCYDYLLGNMELTKKD